MPFILDYKRADRVPTVQVQEALTRKGYTPGPTDGRFGVQTMRAVVAFQTANGADPTGVVDEVLFAQIVAVAPPTEAAKPKSTKSTKSTPKAASKKTGTKSGSTSGGSTATKGTKQ